MLIDLYGKRRVTGSTDHRLKVFDRQLDASWKLIDTWRGHDAEILDVGVLYVLGPI